MHKSKEAKQGNTQASFSKRGQFEALEGKQGNTILNRS